MATYCFKCRECGSKAVAGTQTFGYQCYCGGEYTRDYRAENVGVAVARLRMEREEGGSGAIRDLFLPTASEYAGPGDPDGSKGIREWNDTHDPKPGNKAPMRPDMPLHSKEIL